MNSVIICEPCSMALWVPSLFISSANSLVWTPKSFPIDIIGWKAGITESTFPMSDEPFGTESVGTRGRPMNQKQLNPIGFL